MSAARRGKAGAATGIQPAVSGFWDMAEACTAIAFGEPKPLTGWIALRPSQWTRKWRYDPQTEIAEALQAHALGTRWQPKGQLIHPAREYHAHVRKLMRETGLSATELLRELHADIDRRNAFEATVEQARQILLDAVRNGTVTALGRPAFGLSTPDLTAAHVPILGTLLLGPRTIGLNGWLGEDSSLPLEEWFECRGPYFDAVRFRTEDLKAAGLVSPPQRIDERVGQSVSKRPAQPAIDQFVANFYKAAYGRGKKATEEQARAACADHFRPLMPTDGQSRVALGKVTPEHKRGRGEWLRTNPAP